ncbi:hypothetical protein O0I10_001641 [Lichtheimia ornata]|uniref:Uncharacterized protein n=1 Tax=Lichtheimia ornata TaxID=688661 RepID=A0AAD7Y2W0_9FUNG|nr:uncharacterized protein O0I10_001641 [Lichtheimia ornata]KAJ8662677.1 hypothetical protein O0I10_001641 [Lichtheimia ornata]
MIFDKVVRYFSANSGQQLAGRGGKQHHHHHVNKIQKTNATATMATNTSTTTTLLQVPNQSSIPTSSSSISQSAWHQRMILSRATHHKLRHPPPIQHRGLQRTIHLKNMLKRLQQEDMHEDNVPLASIQL